MSLKKLCLFIMGAGFAPAVAFGSMAYVPTHPCSYYPGCVQATQKQQAQNQQQMDYSRNYSRKYDFSKRTTSFDGQQRQSVSNSNTSKDMYVAANIMASFWSWTNEYKSDYTGDMLVFSKDEYSFENVFGGSVALGMYFTPKIRGDVELGITTEFSDKEDLAKYTMSAPYLSANVYYDFEHGFYVGGGLGLARPTTTIGGALFAGNTVEKSSITPKFSAMVGYSTNVADDIYVDLRYRLSGFNGTKMSQYFVYETEQGNLQVEGSFIMENTVSAGIRYKF